MRALMRAILPTWNISATSEWNIGHFNQQKCVGTISINNV